MNIIIYNKMSTTIYQEIAELLNANPKMADTMDLKQLGALLEASEEAYYNTEDGEESILDDTVYDYAKDTYERRRKSSSVSEPAFQVKVKVKIKKPAVVAPAPAPAPAPVPAPISGSGIKIKLKKSTASPAPALVPVATKVTEPVKAGGMKIKLKHHVAPPVLVPEADGDDEDGDGEDEEIPAELAHVPQPKGNLFKLPYWMGSMDKLVHGEGTIISWTSEFSGPYVISAKVDGASALYCGGKLYSRGKGVYGQDISHLLTYLKLPEVTYCVRGELVLTKSVFDEKYKKPTLDDMSKDKYRNGRNAVAGLINSIGKNGKNSNYNRALARDLQFIVYEIMPAGSMIPSKQLELLEKDGFNVVYHEKLASIDDDVLSDKLDTYIKDLPYMIDGIVIYNDQPYIRNTSGNPKYAKAYKKDLESLMATTTVIRVSWKCKRSGYIKPVLVIEPVEIDGTTVRRCTAHNAKVIESKDIGPGSVIEIIRSKGVIPKLIDVLEATGAQMPSCPYVWNKTHTDISFVTDEDEDEDEESEGHKKDIAVDKLKHFIVTIGAKGIGPATLEKIYDIGFTTVTSLFNITEKDLSFLGAVMSAKLFKSFNTALSSVTLSVFMAGTGCFGTGIGKRKLAAIFKKYPDLLELPEVENNDIPAMTRLIQAVPGFALITSKLVADGMNKFMTLFYDLSEDIQYNLINNIGDDESSEVSEELKVKHPELAGKNICLTGFRSPEITAFIKTVGAHAQEKFSATTNILIIKDASYSNKKTEDASKRGIKVITKQDFIDSYL